MIRTSEGSHPNPEPTRAYQAISASAVGLEMGLAVLLCSAIGVWLDGKYGTEPYLTLVLLGLGIAAGFKGIYRVAKQTKRALSESNQTQSDES